MNKNQKMNTAQLDISDEESMILEEEIDENYQPTQEEILEYAQFLGMDLQEDQDLFHIAREGLKAPLPDVWKPAKNRNGDIYYINLQTKEAQWEHPCDEHYKKVYQDAKKKKTNKVQSKAVSKFKSSFPAVNSSSPLAKAKASGLPIIKDLSTSSKDEDEYGKRENNNIFEIQDVASLNHQESSIDSSPKRLINKKPVVASRHAEPTLVHNFDFEVPKDDFTEIDDEYDRKFFLYKQEKEKGMRKAKEDLKAEKSNKNDEMEMEIAESLDGLKAELIKKVEVASKAFVESKRKIQEDLTIEHHKNLESRINQLEEEKEKRIAKLKTEAQEDIGKLETGEHEKAIKENEAKIVRLKEEIESLEKEKSNFEEKKKSLEESQNKKLEEDKKKSAQDLKNQLNLFAIEEAERQKEEVQNYRNSLEIKLNEEKSTLLVAKQKTGALQMARNSDLKEKYDRKFEIEKEKIDNEMRRNLNDFEVDERSKKDESIRELEKAELQVIKDKKQIMLQKELQGLQETYKKRLSAYEIQLKEKLSNEKQNLESEIKSVEQKLKHEVENIRLDLNNQEQIFEQIKKAERAEEEINKKVQEVNRKVEKQQNENNKLRDKLESLRRKNSVAPPQGMNKNETIIRELENQIKQMELKITNLSKQTSLTLKENNKSSYLSPTSLRSSNLMNGNGIKKEFPYVKIIEDIEEIKTILTTHGDEKDQTVSGSVYRRGEGSRLPSPKCTMTPHKSMFLSHVRSNSQLLIGENKWKNIYLKECDNLQEIKEQIKECKNKIAKKQQTLLKKQGKLKKDCQKYNSSDNKNIQRKRILKDLKHNLDKQVEKMNSVMFKIRDADMMFAEKNELFKEFEQMVSGDIDNIQMVYDEYLKIQVVVPVVEDEGEEFYEVWENILENQSALEINFEGQNQSSTPTTWENGVKNIKDSFYFENKLQLSQGFGPKGTLQYSYDNLFGVLDQQTKSFEYEKEQASLKQKQSPSHFREQREQVSSLFLSHSTWLQDMKQKLNYQLYDKSASLPSKDLFASGRTLY